MKLSEVIKNDDDLYKCAEFKNKNFKAVRTSDSINVMFEFDGKEMGVYVPLDGWEEVKPPRRWSEKELMLFKLLPDWVKWIGYDKNGSLVLSENESVDIGRYIYIDKRTFYFITITFEESPIYIGDLKNV